MKNVSRKKLPDPESLGKRGCGSLLINILSNIYIIFHALAVIQC